MFDLISSWPALLVQAVLLFVAALGTLQIAALRGGLGGLAWPVGVRHQSWGYFVAIMLLMIALLGEAIMMLAGVTMDSWWWVLTLIVGSMLALAVSIVGAAMRLRWNRMRQRQRASQWGHPVELGPLRAIFYRPTGAGPFPAVCLVPDPCNPGDDLTPLVQAILTGRVAALVFDLQSLDHADRLTLQGLVSVGTSHLAERVETDAERLGILGVGLGGDLALRGAAMDTGIAAALAIEPVLSPQRPMRGLEMLRNLSWFEAHRRAWRWHRSPLVEELDALTAIPRAAPRPVAIVVGYADDLNRVDSLEILRVEGGCPLTPAIHRKTAHCAAQWFTENLA